MTSLSNIFTPSSTPLNSSPIKNLIFQDLFYSKLHKKCDKCDKKMEECDSCSKMICLGLECLESLKCLESKNDHVLCLECKVIPVCSKLQVCGFCYRNYHYITDRVAIGNSSTSYDLFDIIVNMDCPNNGMTPGQLIYSYREKDRKHIIKCGIQDCSQDEYEPFAKHVFEEITKALQILIKKGELKKNKKYPEYPRILFHCYAGVSRSVAAATWYLSKTTNLSTESIFEMIKEKRKVANPNPCFRKILKI